jgi:glycerol-3-phosphate dehydrogenase (NAD(P)+)
MQTLLADRHALFFWDKAPLVGVENSALEIVAAQADFVIFCLPVNPHREIAVLIAPLLNKNCICISIAKGLDEAGRTAAQIFAQVFGAAEISYALLYGPMIAEELQASGPGFAQLACDRSQSYLPVQALFAGSALQLSASSDINGISWSVILKNVYAMAFGISDELGLGDNVRGFLLVSAMRELAAIVQRLGGEAGSVYDLAGLGDLVTTATSEHSHHHALGRKLARGEHSEIRGEGVHTLMMVEKYGIFPRQDYPLFSLLHGIVLANRDPAAAIADFLAAGMFESH